MVERETYNKGQLVMTRVSGDVRTQELIDHVFWLIDSHNIGEVRSGFDQVVYTQAVDSVNLGEADVQRLTEISTGLGQARGKFRTAIVATAPDELKMAYFYQTLAERADLEVAVCSNFEEAFAWLGCDNPDPGKYA